MGKASVSYITVSLGLAVAPKALAMARVGRLWLAGSRSFLYPPPGSVRWHLTAPSAGTLLLKTPPQAGTLLLPPFQLAPYCYSPAGTLLLTFLAGIHSARWLRSPFSPPPIVRPFLGYA